MDNHKQMDEHRKMVAMSWGRFLAMIATSTVIMARPFHARFRDWLELPVCTPLFDQCKHAERRISYLGVT